MCQNSSATEHAVSEVSWVFMYPSDILLFCLDVGYLFLLAWNIQCKSNLCVTTRCIDRREIFINRYHNTRGIMEEEVHYLNLHLYTATRKMFTVKYKIMSQTDLC